MSLAAIVIGILLLITNRNSKKLAETVAGICSIVLGLVFPLILLISCLQV